VLVCQATITLYGVVYAVPDEDVATVVRQALQAHLPDARSAPVLPSHSGTVEWLER
jgi:hypothetical protein